MSLLEHILQKVLEKIASVIAVFSQLFLYFPCGSKASNIEIAIAGYKLLQEKFYTREAFPQDWAWIQNELGCAYNCRIRGETAENLELAIEAFKSALPIYIGGRFSNEWAKTQTNLGITYCYRLRGDKNNNLEAAIKAFELALQVYSCEGFPENWAWTQNQIGYAYMQLKKEDVNNVEKAIQAFELALQVYTVDKFPSDWAITQNNLANTYLKRQQGNKEDNLEQAIHIFNSVLKKLINKQYPSQWAKIKNNLGIAYIKRKNGYKKDNLKLAVQAFESALQIYNSDDFPHEWATTQGNIGYAYQNAENYTKAHTAFAAAINIAESLRAEIISGSGIEADKQKLAEEWNPYYQNIVEVCLELAQDQPQYFADAMEYAELSKSRNLVELLATKNLYPKEDFYDRQGKQEDYERHCKELDELRRKNSSKQRQKESQEELKSLRKKRDNLLKNINDIDKTFKFTQKVNKISFSEMQALVKEDTVLIEWYITNSKIITFIVNHNKESEIKNIPFVLTSSSEDLDSLISLCKQYLQAYYATDKEKWQSKLNSHFRELAKILHIEEILSHIPETCNRLILVPHRFLHLLPLHALPLSEEQDKCLLDQFEGGVRYAPSCQLLQLSQRLQRTEFSNLFAVQNPKNVLASLKYAKLEVDVIRSFFSSNYVLQERDASEVTLKVSENLPSSHCCHFCCHGEFDLKSPLESALLLAEHGSETQKEDGRLTLAEIFGLTLDKCRLVTLSGCETGMVDPDSISDEYIGLPSSFLFAGSPSIVASLWKVNDISTALLMIKFYENLIEHWNKSSELEESAVAIALNKAQIWLRDLTRTRFKQSIEHWTKQPIEQWIKSLSLSYIDEFNLRSFFSTRTELEQWIENLSLRRTDKFYLERSLLQHQDEEKPFCQPYHWAAFCAIGQ
ncbi:CHAT domain-containing tetratricopeptide repeat protein [Nostoc sp. FACHB-133]|uniref:CHAT domain-containing protein n=1 Tax=Nostoc sp. FACHB-133 TaxID=2692835 RepID=UPI0016825151|nr:CHAT domain-containing tetratricopeptide repeat protein [Nostoc sp. FACHB-133]MBD2525251.1 CHAT domain-containing protein [Nostoc sp. FACHB-133]